MTNPYAAFVKSLSDVQLDTLRESVNTESEFGDLWLAVTDEYESRERRTSLTFFTPHVDEFKRLLAAELEHPDMFFARSAAVTLRNKRLLNGWSHELEAALKILIIEMVEQIS